MVADFRGYTSRKQKFSPEKEAKIKLILNASKSRSEALKLLQREKFRDEDIVRILQKYYRRGYRDNVSNISLSEKSSSSAPSPVSSPSRKGQTKDQQLKLISFAQNVHKMNQEVNKHLRTNKPGINVACVSELPSDYKRPPGFSVVPSILGTNNKHHALNLIRRTAYKKQAHLYESQEPSR